MSYDKEFWDNYAKENESRYNEEFAKFIRDLAISLRCKSVLEIGCGTGIDLRLFPDTLEVHGIDLNDLALDMAKKNGTAHDFKKGSITKLPFADSCIDFIICWHTSVWSGTGNLPSPHKTQMSLPAFLWGS
jgi:ubiquinone/menaquinone biosynthesis C-methylase UbiE